MIRTLFKKVIASGFKGLLFLAIGSPARSQVPDSLTLKKIGTQLIQQEMTGREGIASPGDNCLRDKDGHFLSCFSAESSAKLVADLNGDAVADAVFLFSDEGLGGGGNAFGFDYRVVLLNRKYEIVAQHSIFGGGKFSYGHLEIDSIKKGKIWATYNENPMSRSYGESASPLQYVSLVFSIKEEKLVDDAYARCPLAAMKKQIFKKDSALKIQTSRELDDQFNESHTELVDMNDGTQITAILNGCEDLDLYFGRTIPYKAALQTNALLIKEVLVKNLQFLKNNTLFKTVIQNAVTKLNQLNVSDMSIGNNGGAAIHLSLPDGWKTHLFVSGNKEQGSFITIRFEKPKYNNSMMDFWESMKSKNRLR